MDTVNALLIHGANALLWLWEAVKGLAGWLWSALDAILNPVLSPLLAILNPICTTIGDVVYAVLSPVPPWLGLTILSAVAGVVMLIAFRYVSNQEAIGRAKDDIKANLLALKLYKDDLRVMFQAQGRLLWAILRLQRYMLTPVLIMLLPMLLGLAQMGTRHQWRPLRTGERALIRVTGTAAETSSLNGGDRYDSGTGAADSVSEIRLERSAAVEVEVGPVPGGGAWVWRVRGGAPGRHTLQFHADGETIEKELIVGEGFSRVSAVRVGSDWATQLLHPVEGRLPHGAGIDSIEILYPGRDGWFCGATWWVLSFFVISMATALLLKPVFRVRF
jgi:uncharacterized membrane protein (DUF106 family)